MRLPQLKPREVARALERAGFERHHQTGSHLIMVNRAEKKIVSVPIHPREMKRGLLIGIIKQSGLTQKNFIELI